MSDYTVTVSYAGPNKPDSGFDYRECVFSISSGSVFDEGTHRIVVFDGYADRVSLSFPICEDGMRDERVVRGGDYKCRDMTERFRHFASGKELERWELLGDLKKKYYDLLHNSSIPPLFDAGEARIDWDYHGRECFRVTMNVSSFMSRSPSIVWTGTYEWTGRLKGEWKPLQDLVDLVIDSHKTCAAYLRDKEKEYEASVEETVANLRKGEEQRRKRYFKRSWTWLVGIALTAFATATVGLMSTIPVLEWGSGAVVILLICLCSRVIPTSQRYLRFREKLRQRKPEIERLENFMD